MIKDFILNTNVGNTIMTIICYTPFAILVIAQILFLINLFL